MTPKEEYILRRFKQDIRDYVNILVEEEDNVREVQKALDAVDYNIEELIEVLYAA